MGQATSSFYGFLKLRDASPAAADWASTDGNWEMLSKILHSIEQHHHNGTKGIDYPGYVPGDPTNPILPVLTQGTGGVLIPGTTVGVRVSYTDSSGLETSASPEQDTVLPAAITPPLPPILVSLTTAANTLGGGVYIYALTKVSGTGETTISDTLPVQVLYDQTYQAQIQFDSISTYTDGTTALNVYRANGQNAPFQLLTQITSTSATTFTDTNVIPSGNQNIQPPGVSTFNAAYKVNIDWSTQTVPTDAVWINVYVTRQPGIWGVNCLLARLDIATSTAIDYLGSESLGPGSPNSSSEVVSSPPPITLGTESDLGTVDADLKGFQIKGLRLQNSAGVPAIFSSPSTGEMYYDTTAKTVRAYINGTWTNWGTTTASAYTHPSNEVGGHAATGITYGSATADTVFKVYADSAGVPQQFSTIVIVNSDGKTYTTTSTSPTVMTDGTTTDMKGTFTPSFTNQYIEVVFSALVAGSLAGINIGYAIYSGVTGGSITQATYRQVRVNATNEVVHLYMSAIIKLSAITSYTFQGEWYVDTGTATADKTYPRFITCKGLH